MSDDQSIPVPGYESAITDVGFHKINIRGYALEDIIRNLNFTEVIYLVIKGEVPTPAQLRVMDAVLCGIVDHGLFAPTSLAARVIASATPDSIMPGVAGGLLTVGAVTVSPQDTAEIIQACLNEIAEKAITKEEAAGRIVAQIRQQKSRFPGIGHPLHPAGDPRAIALKEVAIQNGMWGEKGQLYELMVAEFTKMVQKELPVNIDGMMGCVLSELGFAPKEMAGIAALSFMPGIIAHAVEETGSIKLRTAECRYTGVPPRKLPDKG
jgi:citrate synthase